MFVVDLVRGCCWRGARLMEVAKIARSTRYHDLVWGRQKLLQGPHGWVEVPLLPLGRVVELG